jgi:2-dehydropantoate 2-reductase
MNITVVGAGAIGGTVGAYLVRAGYSVTFCDTVEAHVAVIRDNGLTIRGWAETFTVHAPACTPAELNGPLELVLLAVKAHHTRAALQIVAPLLSESGYIVSLQNGLNEYTIAEAVGARRTIGCFINFSADYLEPGLIHFGGPGAFKIGELDGVMTPRLKHLHELLSAWGQVDMTDNIWGYLWGKLGYANMLYATALVDASMAEVIDRYRLLMVALATEVYRVADALHITPEPFDGVEPALYYPPETRDWPAIQRSLDALVERRRRDQKTRSGIWRDLAVRRRRTEVDEQLGAVIRQADSLNLPVPLMRRIVQRIHELEDDPGRMSWALVVELETMRQAEEAK